MKTTEILEKWVSTLPLEKLKYLVIQLTEYAIDSEEVAICDDTTPYWRSTGDRLED